jgi:hypothetical protein
MSRTLFAVLILSEVVSAVLIYRLWTRKLRAGRWERGWLTLALLAPFIGWLLYGFLEPPPDRPRLKLLDEGAVAADPDRLELLWLLRHELDDALLHEMAGCGGGPDQAENIEALTEILQTGAVRH